MKKMNVRLTLTEEALGTMPSDPEIHDRFIASKAPDAKTRNEELADFIAEEGIDAAYERGTTVFAKDERGKPFLYDYQLKGFFKDACGMLRRSKDTKSAKMTAYKKVIDGNIFVTERRVPIVLPKGEYMGLCQRPLRAQTAQGERVSLACSETVPAGSTLEFGIMCMNDSDMATVREWLAYGKIRGLCQWRNSGKGTFDCEIVSEEDADISEMLSL